MLNGNIFSVSRIVILCVWLAGQHHSAAEKKQLIAIDGDHRNAVIASPESQNIPLDPRWQALRPPKPRISDQSNATIFIGLAAFRDGERCGTTLFTSFKRAKHPDRVFFGIVDQREHDEVSCVDAYCEKALTEWPDENCKYKDHVIVDHKHSNESRGPTYARSLQQKLIGDQEFCMQLDAHSIFTNEWDIYLIQDWLKADNEMAVLSTYIYDIGDFVTEKGDSKPPKEVPHLCRTTRGGCGLVRNTVASKVLNAHRPQMSALFGAGLSFSKCHAEKRALVDPHTKWMFDGEEFLRSSLLWTNGYDIYSPSFHGSVVYHNYSAVPKRFHAVDVDQKLKESEREMGENRFRAMVGMEFKGLVNMEESKKYGFGTVRSFDAYLNFSGVSFTKGINDTFTCHQLHWVPYTNPGPVENLLSDWRMIAKAENGESAPGQKVASLRQAFTPLAEAAEEFQYPSLLFPRIVVIVVLLLMIYYLGARRQRLRKMEARRQETHESSGFAGKRF